MILDGCAAANRQVPFGYAEVAAATPSQVSTAPGRLFQLTILTAGTAALTVWDNASGAASGTRLFAIPANAPLGTTYLYTSIPVSNGIFVAGGANTPSVGVAYNA